MVSEIKWYLETEWYLEIKWYLETKWYLEIKWYLETEWYLEIKWYLEKSLNFRYKKLNKYLLIYFLWSFWFEVYNENH